MRNKWGFATFVGGIKCWVTAARPHSICFDEIFFFKSFYLRLVYTRSGEVVWCSAELSPLLSGIFANRCWTRREAAHTSATGLYCTAIVWSISGRKLRAIHFKLDRKSLKKMRSIFKRKYHVDKILFVFVLLKKNICNLNSDWSATKKILIPF